MKSDLITALAFLVLGMLSLPSGAAAKGLLERKVEITVKGTNIDRFPNYVEVITANPRVAAEELIASGGRNLEEHALTKGRYTVFHHEVLHIFHTVDDYKSVKGHSFEDGDVIYKYFLDSEADEKEFVKQYDLRTATPDARFSGRPIVLYYATPGFYVIASGKPAGIASNDDSVNATAPTAAFRIAQDDGSNPEQGIQVLLTQRRDVLRERKEAVESAFKSGVADANEVIMARNDLLDAELELAADQAERVAIRESMVAEIKDFEDLVRRQVNQGSTDVKNVLAATAERLKAEIELRRERTDS